MLVLGREQVEALLDVEELFERLEQAFVELSAGRASVPPRVAAHARDGFLAAMPGYIGGVLEAKLVSVFPGHEPSHQALIAVFDAETGAPRAVMDGTHITAVRTGASSAVAIRALAREDVRVLAVLGAGVQARSHLDAVRRMRDFDVVRVASRTHVHAEALAAESGATAVCSFEEAVRGADVVCCCTHADAPVLRRDWLDPGTHVCSVGVGDGPELDAETIHAGLLVVESAAAFQPFPAGTHELSGLDPSLAIELGQILGGGHPGRTSEEQITVYKSMGHAVEDAAAAALVLERAQG